MQKPRVREINLTVNEYLEKYSLTPSAFAEKCDISRQLMGKRKKYNWIVKEVTTIDDVNYYSFHNPEWPNHLITNPRYYRGNK